MQKIFVLLCLVVMSVSCGVLSNSSQQPTESGKIEYKHHKPAFKMDFYGDYQFNKFTLKDLPTAADYRAFLKKDLQKNKGKAALRANTFVEPFFHCMGILYAKPLQMKKLKNELLSDKDLQLTNLTQDSIVYNTTGQTIYSISYIILDKKTATKYAHREYFVAADTKTLRLIWVGTEDKNWNLENETKEIFQSFICYNFMINS
ncbi:hypothetical protein SAMN05421780_11089 [Flexibacter flexilis DSM 6793]|uniref:Lipoprotein n=1 Tax=Flexibacter flexilis DSM 6793 TaxID=927664 RepID=A0A1I1M9C6_9BACT|nr:hypothetical protein [Flexibacter flexilis]SFC82021.1 hypothetical protein SAMN05421780_11089 [Flexibacter flexilis DSM 6793]